MRALPSPLLVVTDRHGCIDPPPHAGEGGRGATGRGDRDLSGKGGAPLSRPSLTRGPTSPAERGGDARTDDPTARLLLVVCSILEGGARWVWLRERDMDHEGRRSLADDLLRVVRAFGGILTIGGDPGLAAVIGAEGVHLPGTATADDTRRARGLLPASALVGISAHSLRDVEAAARAGADYVTLSPIFETASKPGYGPALGPELLRAASHFGLPVIALGGITAANAPACREAGAAGIAAMGGLIRAADPAEAARTLLTAWR